MAVVESILDIPVQDPEEEEFCWADLTWTKFRTSEREDDVALIPYERVDAFIIGECSNIECPTRFHIERVRKRSFGSLKEYKNDDYLEYRLYWCSFGPENYGEGGGILPSRRYRLNTRNRAARPQSMRGCKCHFVVKRLYARPSLALLVYNDNDRRHVNDSGFVCHGPLDRDAIGPGAKKIPYICNEIQQQTMSMIYLGIPEENVLEKHIEGIQRYCGSNAKVNSLASQYVHKLGMIIRRSTHELDLDDHASIQMWVERNRKSIFFYQDTSEADSFILGIQTEWQLQQMIRFGHRSLIAADSTFGIKRLKYPLSTLLVFDSRQHALPVAWVITRSFAKLDVSKWMKALFGRARSVEPGWKVSGFLIDDAAAEIDPIRDIFCCPVLFSLWRVRRSWLRNIVRKCSNIEVQREIFKRLGKMVYSIWGGVDTLAALEELAQDFVDQTAFMEYFKASWVPKIEMWLSTIRTLPLASQEASGAVEAYHVKLKAKLFDDSHLGALQRVDWLVHKLTTELHSSYWLDRYADESDSFQNVKEEYIASTSWHRALQIPDSAVTLDDHGQLFAKVLSQKDSSLTRLVWNPGSEFAFCDCAWSIQGNLCKHVIKVNTLCANHQSYQPSMSFQSFKEILMNLWRKPMDDSVSLDLSVAWTHQMLDQLQKLVEITSSSDIGTVVNNLPLKWVSKKGRTNVGKRSPPLALPSSSKGMQTAAVRKKNRKRKIIFNMLANANIISCNFSSFTSSTLNDPKLRTSLQSQNLKPRISFLKTTLKFSAFLKPHNHTSSIFEFQRKGLVQICHSNLRNRNSEDPAVKKGDSLEGGVGGSGNGGEGWNWSTSILLLVLWGALMYYVFNLTPNQTPSRDMYFLQKLLNLKGDDGFRMNEVLVSLWYIMGLWPLVYSMLLLPTGRSSKSKIPVWPFLILSFFGGAYALLPYFVLWKPPPPPVEETEVRRWPLNFLESKLTAGISLAAGLGIIVYAGLANWDDWKEFAQYFRESKFIHIMSLDFTLLSAFAPFWVYNDMTARKWFDKGSWLLPLSAVPFLGPALYLVLRPSLTTMPISLNPTTSKSE